MLHLTDEEQRAIDAVVARQSGRAKHPIAVATLLERWTRFVTTVEQGYTDSIYEYTNDLSTRDLLREVLEQVPEALQGKLHMLVQPIDDRFNETTRISARPVTGGKNSDVEPWWFRIPKRLSGELADDLQDLG